MITSTYISNLVQDCSNSIANAMELPQSYTKPLMTPHHFPPRIHINPLSASSTYTE